MLVRGVIQSESGYHKFCNYLLNIQEERLEIVFFLYRYCPKRFITRKRLKYDFVRTLIFCLINLYKFSIQNSKDGVTKF